MSRLSAELMLLLLFSIFLILVLIATILVLGFTSTLEPALAAIGAPTVYWWAGIGGALVVTVFGVMLWLVIREE